MKRVVLLSVCFIGLASFAQNIPSDSLDYYRKSAHVLFIENRMDEAVELYKNLALSGDALSGYQLHDIYSQGKGVPKDPQEAEKWRSLAESTLVAQQAQSKAVERLFEEKPLTFQEVLNESGRLIEKGAREKNAAAIVGLVGGGAGITLIGIGSARQAESMGKDGRGAVIAGYVTIGVSSVVALIVNMVGNRHIKQGGEMMRRVKISGNGISVKF